MPAFLQKIKSRRRRLIIKRQTAAYAVRFIMIDGTNHFLLASTTVTAITMAPRIAMIKPSVGSSP